MAADRTLSNLAGSAARPALAHVLAFMARTDIGMSPWPVMKMTGRLMPCTASSRCRSTPLRPGRRISSTTRRRIQARALQEVLRGAEGLDPQSHGPDETLDRFANRRMVIDYIDD